jgi:hypothetical protein
MVSLLTQAHPFDVPFPNDSDQPKGVETTLAPGEAWEGRKENALDRT